MGDWLIWAACSVIGTSALLLAMAAGRMEDDPREGQRLLFVMLSGFLGGLVYALARLSP